MRSLALLALLLASTSLLAQDSSADTTPTNIRPCAGKNPSQPCVVQPVVISQPVPDYSDEGREEKVEGEVFLDFVVVSTAERMTCALPNPSGQDWMKSRSKL